MPQTKSKPASTPKPEAIMYAVKLGDEIVSVEATSASDAEQKAKKVQAEDRHDD